VTAVSATLLAATVLAVLCTPADTIRAAEPCEKKKAEPKWTDLFDGKSLKGWEKTEFGGEGEVTVEDGNIVMEFGGPLTGVHYKGKEKLPTMNYELSLDAMKADGEDFFCGLTFPVEKSFCSLIVGGWAGGIVGISSIDGQDASENETTEFRSFKKQKWYHIRVRVTPGRLQAWIDNEQIVDVIVKDRKLEVRPEVDLSKPIGICAFETRAKLRKIRIRKLTADDLTPAKDSKDSK
jgi:hypothetical protein